MENKSITTKRKFSFYLGKNCFLTLTVDQKSIFDENADVRRPIKNLCILTVVLYRF